MKNYSPQLLADAKAMRADRVAKLTEQMKACTCAYPIKLMRNGHGHDDDCPAVAVWERHRALDGYDSPTAERRDS